MLSQPVIDVIRREVRRLSPDVRVDAAQIREALMLDVLKRDVIEGEKAQEAARKIARAASRALRAKATNAADQPDEIASDDSSENEAAKA
jgi:hypothetical protein